MKLGRVTLGALFIAVLAGCGSAGPEEVTTDGSNQVEASMELPCDGSRTWEYTYYDVSGTAVGGRWCDCSGYIATWGVRTGDFELWRGTCR
ncbi:hypothetical protein HPC49_18310 [Pyxidicoccus fallax]|uniref:Lipoprotein n=1 Tax=Pyxidicoccus fallax TaxID=394095 RepID=A0A848LIR1_9BACT|nr:DUF6289 family protein [Pyxidicoccus fallax]NMO17604.1 hypothetical protein [Pyxidicoccus fallax]NPC80164.1 hypothetical protein [Pyxidicoccus fallax]